MSDNHDHSSIVDKPQMVVGSIYIPVLDDGEALFRIENLGPLNAASILTKIAATLIDQTIKNKQLVSPNGTLSVGDNLLPVKEPQ